MLWLCLHFPRLPIEIFLRAGSPPDPFIVSTGGHREQVAVCDARARHAGICPGMAVSATHALAPRVLVRTRDVSAERRALEGIALWALQFTSQVSVLPAGSLLLEIGGSLKFFGGLDALGERIRIEATALGFDATVAVAPTPRGAHWLARAGLEPAIEDHATLRHHLSRLPVDCLEAGPDVLGSFQRIGVRTIGEFSRLPRDGVARRFGQDLLDQVDRAFGALPDPQVPFVPPARFRADLALPSPVTEVEALLFAAHRLILQLAGYLSACNAGVTRLQLALLNESGGSAEAVVALSIPSRDTKHLVNLLRERLSLITLPDRIDSIRLEAVEVAQLAPRNLSFFPDREQSHEGKAALVEKLRARLGNDAVQGLSLYPDARPELAWREAEPGANSGPASHLPRPVWLLPRPRRLDMQDDMPALDGRLTLLKGPERIESGWWDGNDVMRDYYVARSPSGATFWIYRERSKQADWFLHGVFS
jgi:protein ImuB